MESIVNWYQSTLGQWLPREVFIFFLSMLPFIELRGGLIAASLLGVPLAEANIICVLGNIVPIPFILLFIRKIFEYMKKHNILRDLVLRIERRAEKKSKKALNGEFIFLLFFVGIPIPGTGAWMGALIASLFDFRIKRAVPAILLGLLLAVAIMDIVSYGILGSLY